jgi:hypothetical protein
MDKSKVTGLEDNIFYCVFADGTSKVIVAESADEISNANLVISLAEVNEIQKQLASTQKLLLEGDDVAFAVKEPKRFQGPT